MGSRTPLQWFAIVQRGEVGWNEFYQAFMHRPISQPDRFFKAVENLGHTTVFNAIIAASLKKLDGDPLSYVLAIAMNTTLADVKEKEIADKYEFAITKARHQTEIQNEELQKRINNAKEISSGITK